MINETMDECAFNYLLVDLENVQPKAEEIGRLLPGCKVQIFTKAGDKISIALALALQTAESCEFVLIEGTGKNALDFHIACQLGLLSRDAPGCFVYVVSKDTGYDSVIKWVNGHTGITAKRVSDFDALPKNVCLPPPPQSGMADNAADATSPPEETAQSAASEASATSSCPSPYGTLQENAEKAIADLNRRKQSRPRKRKTLMNTLNACFQQKLPEKLLVGLVNYLVTTKKCINIDEMGNVTYAPPITNN